MHKYNSRKEVLDEIRHMHPEMAEYIESTVNFHSIRTSQLSLEKREITIIGALVAQNSQPQLKVHLIKLLDMNITFDEISEIILQLSVYVGMPYAINSILTLKEIHDKNV
mgnify:CR=1 FL=1|jgi:alkylhydroperoxidase/carboxymuconolactone decarboxylase family protein YurZ|tara:strand:+ start:52051 stop:52380 length:330 start_codon:yes stop_codon:yes gene_type:complete